MAMHGAHLFPFLFLLTFEIWAYGLDWLALEFACLIYDTLPFSLISLISLLYFVDRLLASYFIGGIHPISKFYICMQLSRY